MGIRNLVLSFALTAFAVPGFAFAQNVNQATVLLRDGTRVSGEVEDVHEGTLYLRVSLHDQRKLDMNNVALIDFVGGARGLPETELSVARQPGDVAVLKGGESLKGEFVDIHGGEATTPGQNAETLIFRTDGQERRVDINQVGRIYLGEFPTAAIANQAPGTAESVTTDLPVPENAVRVPATSTWVATPLRVQKGDRVAFDATGRIQLSGDPQDLAHAAGSLNQRYAAEGAPLPQNYAGALIGRVGDSEPFPIGNTQAVTMPADGILYLGINEANVSDNRGEYVVRMARQRPQ